MTFPPDALAILALDGLILIAWIVVLTRPGRISRHMAMLSATAGIWFLGLGRALSHLFEAGLIMGSGGVGDPSSLSRHLGDALIVAATSTQAALFLTLLAVIAFAVRPQPQLLEVRP